MNDGDIRPLLASKAELDKIVYPVLASPKLDGVRCLCRATGPKSRTMKPIQNMHIRRALGTRRTAGLDGELMSDGDFNAVQSAVMNAAGEPDFYYNVFDCFETADGESLADVPFKTRFRIATNRCAAIGAPLRIVPHRLIESEEGLLAFLDRCIAKGFEGAMVRDPEGVYKFGRSTVKEGILLKLKKFLDDEGVLIDIREQMHNGNAATLDELGYTKRASNRDAMVPTGTAGAVVVRWRGIEVVLGFGPGITAATKKAWWDGKEKLLGKYMKFTYQGLSKDGIPRFGKAVGFRDPADM